MADWNGRSMVAGGIRRQEAAACSKWQASAGGKERKKAKMWKWGWRSGSYLPTTHLKKASTPQWCNGREWNMKTMCENVCISNSVMCLTNGQCINVWLSNQWLCVCVGSKLFRRIMAEGEGMVYTQVFEGSKPQATRLQAEDEGCDLVLCADVLNS